MKLPDVQQQVARLRPEMRGAMREMLQRFRGTHAVSLNQAMLLAALELQDCFAFARLQLKMDEKTGRFTLKEDEPPSTHGNLLRFPGKQAE